MSKNSVWLIADTESATGTLQEALDNLGQPNGQVVLDFSSVRRIDSKALDVMAKLAGKARDNAIKVVLRGVNTDVYKVFKLVKLTPSFTFVM